ncbi:DUF4035 domain-containing protein [Streptomyces sp. NPDC091377]|uniref:phage tail assembly protein T n=1 Tax=Streptomyces sp. NPDC091377 TaxID=3365995 RepID=UPI0037FFCBD7
MRDLLARTTSRELAEWQAYETLTGPLGPVRGDIQAALIASVIAGVNRGRGRAPKIEDFVIRWDRTKVKKSPAELFQMARMANAALGGRFNSTTP